MNSTKVERTFTDVKIKIYSHKHRFICLLHSRIIQEMMFDKKKTVYAEAINFTVDMFDKQHNSSNSAKLMIILSDGKGVFVEGEQTIMNAVTRARMQNIFLLFIIVENPANKVTFYFSFTFMFTHDVRHRLII